MADLQISESEIIASFPLSPSPFSLSPFHSFVGGPLFSYLTAALILGLGLLVAWAWKLPDYTEIAVGLGVNPTDGQKALRKLFSSFGFPGWFQPGTDTIVSFAPFNNVPNNYRLTIDGEQKWFGQ